MKKLIYLLLTVLIFSCEDSDGDSEPCGNQPNLQTNVVNQVNYDAATNAYISNLSGNIDNRYLFAPNCEVLSITSQGFVWDTTIQPTINDNVIEADGQQISAQLIALLNETTYYVRTYITNPLGTFYGNQVSFETGNEICEVVYLADNGVTIKACEQANIGDIGVINGVEFTIGDRSYIESWLNQDKNLNQLCTSLLTDMSYMFYDLPFDGDISSWDVSSVTDMSYMFHRSEFNGDLSNWDVSNVTNMKTMFNASPFDGDISSWDVSSVTNMGSMFPYTPFNGDLSNWDVSNVTNMEDMFFFTTSFNQPIGDWDVSSVTNMSRMFRNATSFNQDLSSWDVNNVSSYVEFSLNTPQWTLPKPNFN